MFSPMRSLIVILMVMNFCLIDCVPTVISKTSPPQYLLSPSRKLNTNANNAFVMSRSNGQPSLTESSSNLPNASGARTSRTNLTNDEPVRANEEIVPSQELQSNAGNFTTDDVQITMTNDKQADSNLTNSEAKPFEDNLPNNKETNKEISASQYSNIVPSSAFNTMNNNIPITQIDTFNTNENLEYSALSNDFQCMACSTSLELFNSNQLTRCCIAGYNSCCTGLSNQNLNGQNSASSTNVHGQNGVSNPTSVNTNSNVHSINTPINSPASSPVNNPVSNSPTNNVANINNPTSSTNRNAQPASNVEFYGTKRSKQQSPANKVKSQDLPAKENTDARQSIPAVYNSAAALSSIGFNPALFNGLYLNNRDRMVYSNGLSNPTYNNYLAGLPANLHYSNLNGLSGLNLNNLNLNNLYSNLNNMNSNLNNMNSNLNNMNSNLIPTTNSNTNQIARNDLFSRKTANQANRYGTKTASPAVANANLISDSSISQPIVTEQQYQSKQSQPNNENVQMIQSGNPSVLITNAPASNNPAQQQSTNNQQRLNDRNPNLTTQQQQSQGGISNAFNSLISHIPFIGFNPIPVAFGFSSPQSSAQQAQQQINNQAQVAQLLSASDGGNVVDNAQTLQNYPYGTVIAIRPQSQNAQLITANQLQGATQLQQSNQQLQTKVNSNNAQPANTTPAQPTGFVSTILSRPYNFYQRIGGYFTRPNFLSSSKPVLHYANNQLIPLDLMSSDLLNGDNLSNLQNMLQNIQYYSQPINANLLNTNQNNYETVGQVNPNPLFLYSLLQNEQNKLYKEQAKSSKRS